MPLTAVLVLTLVVIALSHFPGETATEYYVRSADKSSLSCDGEPCHTLTEYISDTDHFFRSNTSFLFMPGTHYMNETLDISHVSNISFVGLEGQPEVLANISCNCSKQCTCIGIRINNITDITFKQLNFNLQLRRSTSKVSRITGFSFAFVSVLTIESCDVNVTITSERKANRGYAINAYACIRVQLLLMQIFYEHDGINFVNVNKSRIAHSAVNSGKKAISMSNTNNASIVNVITKGSVGFDMEDTANVNVTNARVVQARINAIQMCKIENVTITNASIAVVEGSGIVIENSLNTVISKTTLEDFGEHGIWITKANNTRIDLTRVVSSKGNGISFLDVTDTILFNIAVVRSGKVAVNLSHTYTITLKNISVRDSESHGILCVNVINASIMDSRVINCSDDALRLDRSSQCSISSTHVLYSDPSAITLRNTENILIKDMRVEFDNQNKSANPNGILLLGVYNTTIRNVFINKAGRGIVVEFSNNVVIYNATTTNWSILSINLRRSRNVVMKHLRLTLRRGYNQRQIYFSTTSDVLVKDSDFINFSSPLTTTDVTRQPAVIEMYKSSRVVFENTNFIRNNMSCLKLIDSDFEVNDSLQFIGNSAYRGAAMLFLRNSFVSVSENSSILFLNNQATATGGAIHLVTNDYYLSTSVGLIARSKCLLDIGTGRFIFRNNTAGQGGDVLYGGSLGRACTGYNSESEYRSNIRCNSCLKELLNISDVFPKTLSFVTSDPSRVCFCKYGTPDCFTFFHPIPISIHSGQTVMLSAAVVGQNFGTVAGSVYAHFIDKGANSTVESYEQSQGYRQHKCKTFTYTVLSHIESKQKVVLVLTAINKQETQLPPTQTIENQMEQYQNYLNDGDIFPPSLLDFPIYINVTLLPCPPGFSSTKDNPKCGCTKQLQNLPGVICDIQSSIISRQGLVWVGHVTNANTTYIATSSQCPLNYCKVNTANVSMTDPDTQCNHNHSGILCGKCQAGLSLALGSNRCLECSSIHLLLLVPFALSGIVLVLFIKVLDITISQGYINGFIFYANIVKANEHLFLPQAQSNLLTLFISWLNLDLGIETCFTEDMNAITKTWLQLVFPLYVWGIAGIIIMSARYNSKFARIFGNNSVPVLATLFLLSYAKLLRMIVTALSHSIIEYHDEKQSVWSADGNISYLEYPHIMLFLAALAILVILWLPYTLLTLSAQWFLKCDILFLTSSLNRMKPMLDAHYGPLKDKHCYWFGVLLMTRVIILLISTLLPSGNFGIIAFSIVTASFLLTAWSSTGLYRNVLISVHESSLFINLGLLATARFFNDKTQGNQTTAAYFLIGVVFTQFTALILYRVYCIIKPFITCNFNKCHKPQRCHDDGDDGDWRYNDSVKKSKNEMNTDHCPVSDTECYQDGATPSSHTELTDDGTQKTCI